ncbi:MAG: Tar ligand binding domain-containing protein, partial [Hylemonella sp.]|nr:Tar ligand binding domain-containing protein [Hylemonella sp.]
MRKLTLTSRLLLLFGILAMLLAAVAAGSWSGIARTQSVLRTMLESHTHAVNHLAKIQTLLLHNRLLVVNALAKPEPEVVSRNSALVLAHGKMVDEAWRAYQDIVVQVDGELVIAQQLERHRARLIDEGWLPILKALQGLDTIEAYHLLAERVRPLHERLMQDVDELLKLRLEAAWQAQRQVQERNRVIQWLVGVGLVAGLLFLTAFGLMLVRGIKRSLAQASAATDAVAQGDLSYPIEVSGNDEVSA